MLNSIILKIYTIPRLLLGFIIIIIALVLLYYSDPPKTLCHIQMEAIQKTLVKGFYMNDRAGSFGKSISAAFQFCLNSNSPGGCDDMFSRLHFFEKQVRTLPEECGSSKTSLPIKRGLEKALRLFAKISWGGSPPKHIFKKTSWLDSSDIGLYCRMKRQYLRLYGEEAWKTFTWSMILTLPKAETLTKKEIWKKSLFAQICTGFN